VKNIVFVTTELGPGGAEIMLYQLLSRLDRQRFNPSVISVKPKDDRISPRIEALGIPVYTLGLSNSRPSLGALRRLRRLLGKLEPDAIQGWMYHGNFAATVAASGSLKTVPLYWSIHHSLYSLPEESASTRVVLALSRLFVSRVTAIAYVSSISAEQHQAKGFPQRLTVLTPNGFDTDRFKPSAAARAEVRRELGIAPDDVAIGLLSRYIPLKDHDTFLAAAGRLARKHPQALFVLLGHDVEPDNAELMDKITEQDLASRVRLLGHRADTPNILAGLDIVTNSSYSEAFPLVVGEAMATALPCVATDVGDTGLLLGDAGRLVPPRDPRAIAEAWAELIAAGPEARRALGTRARKRILNHFTLEKSVRRYEALYDPEPTLSPALRRVNQ